MIRTGVLLLICSFAADGAVHRATLPSGWIQDAIDLEAASPAPIRVTISLKEKMDSLKKRALEVNDPQNPTYGQFLTNKQISETTAPSPESVATVVSWLKTNGVDFAEKGHRIEISCTPALAAKVFDTQFFRLRQPAFGQASRLTMPTA